LVWRNDSVVDERRREIVVGWFLDVVGVIDWMDDFFLV
jgi:hypothetical protein